MYNIHTLISLVAHCTPDNISRRVVQQRFWCTSRSFWFDMIFLELCVMGFSVLVSYILCPPFGNIGKDLFHSKIFSSLTSFVSVKLCSHCYLLIPTHSWSSWKVFPHNSIHRDVKQHRTEKCRRIMKSVKNLKENFSEDRSRCTWCIP
jgi:hypothetical protein